MRILTGLVSIAFIYLIFTIVVRIRSRPKRKIKKIFHGHVYWEEELNTTMLRPISDNTFDVNHTNSHPDNTFDVNHTNSHPDKDMEKETRIITSSMHNSSSDSGSKKTLVSRNINHENVSWRNCQRVTCSISDECYKPWNKRKKTCCSDSLFIMLSEVTSIFKKSGIDMTIMHGTLIGSLRSNDIIPFTFDVDIAMSSHVYNKWKKWKHLLNEAGYLIFNSVEKLRVCKASTEISNNLSPWAGSWFPYMDIYSLFTDNQNNIYDKESPVRWPIHYLWPTKKCLIRDIEFPCPQKPVLILDSLKKEYGDWRIVQKMGGNVIKKIKKGYPAIIDTNYLVRI